MVAKSSEGPMPHTYCSITITEIISQSV